MNKPHILFLMVFWKGLAITSHRFGSGWAAQSAGAEMSQALTTPTRRVMWRIVPEKL